MAALQHFRKIELKATFRPTECLIAWEFPRLCRGGSRSLTYTAVGHPGNLRWLTHEIGCGCSKAEHKPEAEHRYGKHSPVLSFAIAWVGYLGEAAPSWELLSGSVIGNW